jgi:hypothetical protein
MEAICSSETSIDFQWTTRRYISEDGTLPPGVKRPDRKAEHPPPSSAEGKNGGAIPPPSDTSIRLRGVVLS